MQLVHLPLQRLPFQALGPRDPATGCKEDLGAYATAEEAATAFSQHIQSLDTGKASGVWTQVAHPPAREPSPFLLSVAIRYAVPPLCS